MKQGGDDRGLTLIDRNTVLRGDIETHGMVRVDGVVHGSIHAGGSVILGPSATVYGDIIAASSIIGGFVQGGVYVLGILETGKGGRVRGDVFAASLEAAEGSIFHGRLQISGAASASLSDRSEFMGKTIGETAPAGMKASLNPFPGES